jgi:hypothetical protein
MNPPTKSAPARDGTGRGAEFNRRTEGAAFRAPGQAEPLLSYYTNARAPEPAGATTLEDFIDAIRGDEYKATVTTLRDRLAAGDLDGYAEAKRQLPALSISGKTASGRRMKSHEQGRFIHSGFLQIDLDGKDNVGWTVDEMREVLMNDPHVVAVFISPSGDGVKGIARIPASVDTHLPSFIAARDHFAERKLTVDEACKDPGRLCFVSWDSDAWVDLERTAEFEPMDAAPSEELKPTAPTIKARSKEFPPPPANGIHGWLMEAAWWCRIHDMTEADTVAKLQAFDGSLRRRLQPTEAVDAARKVFSAAPPGLRTWDAAPPVDTINGKPAVELPCPGRPLSEFAADVGSMLAGSGVYSRGGLAFTADSSTKQLSAVDPQWLRTWAEREIVLFKEQKGSGGGSLTLRHSMSLDVAKALTVAPQFLERLPEIKRFAPVRMPVMRADGRIELLPEGFDAETLVLTDPEGCRFLTDISPEIGRKVFDAALAEFPFADRRSRAAAVSAMFTVFAGGLLPAASTTPAFIYLANAEGSGKTTLAQLAGIPYGVCEAEAKPATEEEWQKTLLALVMGGARLLLLDNLKGHLNSPALEAYLTATKFSARILGVNKKFSGDADAVILMTGNRLTVSPDQRRRSIFIELFMEELRAEDRVFKRRLDAPAMLEMQPNLLAAMWALVKGWDEAGRPPASKINSSIPRWSETIAGIVEWAGFGCPSVPADIEDGGDTDTRDIARLGEVMTAGEQVKFAELVDLCEVHGLFERYVPDIKSEGRDVQKARKGFSAVLKTYAGRMIAPGRRFMVEGKGHQRRYSTK